MKVPKVGLGRGFSNPFAAIQYAFNEVSLGRMKTNLASSFWLSTLCCLFALTSCFKERSPKPPDENTSWVTPTEPTVLLENMKKAVTQLDLNNYRRCFTTEKFAFRADPTILANNLGLFSQWNWDNETQYINNLNQAALPASKNNALSFQNTKTQNLSADSIEFTASYTLALYHQDTSFSTVNFNGIVALKMKRNRQNEWQIVTWEDYKVENQKCWTELKQHFFSQ